MIANRLSTLKICLILYIIKVGYMDNVLNLEDSSFPFEDILFL